MLLELRSAINSLVNEISNLMHGFGFAKTRPRPSRLNQLNQKSKKVSIVKVTYFV